MTGRVVWAPKGVHWFVIVEDVVMEERRGREVARGLGRFCVVELPHPHRKKPTRVSDYSTTKEPLVAEAERRNGELFIYYLDKGQMLPGGLYGGNIDESRGY